MIKGKISIIGAGAVGTTCAYTLMLNGLAKEIVLVNRNKDKAEGEILDMRHGISFVSQTKLSAGEYWQTADSEIIIITAGVAQKPGEDRTNLLKRNVVVFKGILESLKPYISDDTILLIVSNPVDILTYVAREITGLPRQRVIGSGAVLDTSRLKYFIGTQTGVDPRSVNTYIIGEHGTTAVAVWSATNVGGMLFDEFCQAHGCCADINDYKENILNSVKKAAYNVIAKKGATCYAVALTVSQIVECILRDEKSILTVSVPLTGEYGINDMALSVPAVLGEKGIEFILKLNLSSGELKDLQHSANSLKEIYATINE